MKKISLFLFLVAFGAATQLAAQAPTSGDCKTFHTGTFIYKAMPNVVVTRTATTQTETVPGGRVIEMSIVWTSDCTYELRLIHATEKSDRKFWKKIKVLVVTITDADEDSYKFSAVSPALAEPVRGTLIKKS